MSLTTTPQRVSGRWYCFGAVLLIGTLGATACVSKNLETKSSVAKQPTQASVGKDVVKRYRAPNRELLAVLQLFRRSNQIISRYRIEEGPRVYPTEVNGKKFEMYDDTIMACDRSDKEIFRTKVEEPFYVRPTKNANTI